MELVSTMVLVSAMELALAMELVSATELALAMEVHPDEISPYTYQYAVADDYSGSRFDASETDDGTAARQGSYSVNLPDGRIQHVNYHANDAEGYVAEVTYDGAAAYPTAVAGHGLAHGGVVGHGLGHGAVGVGHGLVGGVAHIG